MGDGRGVAEADGKVTAGPLSAWRRVRMGDLRGLLSFASRTGLPPALHGVGLVRIRG